MSQIKQLLLLHKQGKGKKTIARLLGISKNTVKDYLQKLDTVINGRDALAIDELVKLENPVLEAKFHSGNPAYKEEKRYDYFKKQIPYFLKELKRKRYDNIILSSNKLRSEIRTDEVGWITYYKSL